MRDLDWSDVEADALRDPNRVEPDHGLREAAQPRIYAAFNGHVMVAHTGYWDRADRWVWVYFNAYCADDCPACAEGEPLPDW